MSRDPVFTPGPIQNAGSTINPTAPTSVANAGFPAGQPRPNLPAGTQNTFQSPTRNPFGSNNTSPFNRPNSPFGNSSGTNRPTGFSNLFANGFSATGLLNGITNLIGNLVAPQREQTVVQNTIVQIVQPSGQQGSAQNNGTVRVQQQTVVPTFQTPNEVITITEVQLPEGAPAVLAIPRTVGGAVDIAALEKYVEEYGTSSIPALLNENVSTAQAPPPSAIPVRELPTPTVFAPTGTSSTLGDIRQSFAETTRIAGGALGPVSEFREVPRGAREVSTREFFREISIPALLEAITDGSARFVRWVFGQESPDTSNSGSGGPTLEEFVGDVRPSFPTGNTPVGTPTGVTGSQVSDVTNAPQRTAEVRIEDRLREDPAATFRDASPAHRGGPVARELPRNIYPDMLPVPVRGERASSTPSFLQLVVENGAREIKNLFTTLWNFVVPPRQ